MFHKRKIDYCPAPIREEYHKKQPGVFVCPLRVKVEPMEVMDIDLYVKQPDQQVSKHSNWGFFHP